MKNYYDTLEVSIDASKEQIKEAYRRLAQKHHPDKNNSNESALGFFQDINEAKQVLFDDAKKAKYDLMLTDYVLANHKELYRREYNSHSNFKFFAGKNKYLNFAIFSFAAMIIFFFVIKFYEDRAGEQQKISAKNTTVGKKEQDVVKEVEALNTSVINNKMIKNEKVSRKASGEIKDLSKVSRPVRNKVVTKQLLDSSSNNIKATFNLVQYSDEQMLDIIDNIKAEKARSQNSTNCVKICKTYNSNIVNGFDIARFLIARGFIISGRETIRGKNKGIKIDATGGCIKITLGVI